MTNTLDNYNFELPLSRFIDDVCTEETILAILNSDVLCTADYDLTNSNILCILGLYYHHIKNDEALTTMYLQNAFDKKNMKASYILACHHENKEISELGHQFKYERLLQYASHDDIPEADYKLGLLYDNIHKQACAWGYPVANPELIRNYHNKRLEHFTKAKDNNHINAIIWFAQYYQKISDFGNMAKYYMKAIDIGSSYASYYFGKYYYDNKKYQEMKKHLLLAISKNNVEAMLLMGDYLESDGQFGEMVKFYSKALTINSNNIKIINKLGQYYYDTEDYDKTMDILLKGIELDNIDSFILLAKYYIFKKSDKENGYRYLSDGLITLINNSNKHTNIENKYYGSNRFFNDNITILFNKNTLEELKFFLNAGFIYKEHLTFYNERLCYLYSKDR
jgi:tetratricopeptide (TPR) repeat protein